VNITDKQMLADMENIIEACKERRCEECIMRPSGKAYCAVTDATPQNWEIPATMSEPEPAEPDKPYLCKLFGVGDRFDVLREDGSVWREDIWLSAAGMLLVNVQGCDRMIECWAFADIIEIAAKHPDRIRRKPKIVLTDDDKAIVRRCIADGLEWFAVDKAGGAQTRLFETCPAKTSSNMFICGESYRNESVAGCLFPWATHEGSPYYLPDLVEGG